MKLTYQFDYGKQRTYRIRDAVERVLDGDTHDSGMVEGAKRTAEQTAEMLGRVVEMLYENGHLTGNQILELLPCYHVADPANPFHKDGASAAKRGA